MQKDINEQVGIIFREKGTLEHNKGIFSIK
jgi:hypothetical protein